MKRPDSLSRLGCHRALCGVLGAVSTVTTTFATMRTQVKTTFTSLEGLGAKGELKSAFASSSACNSLTSAAGK